MLTENQVTVKLRRKKEDVIYAKLRIITQGNRFSEALRLFHWSGIRDAILSVFDKRIYASYWQIRFVHKVDQRYLQSVACIE